MAIINEKDGSIYIITERHSKNCVVVTGGHRYDILKVLARWSKYFNGGDISVNEITKGTKYKVTKKELKAVFQYALETKYKGFTVVEKIALIEIFNIKVTAFLSEQLKIKFPKPKPKGKAWSKEHYNIDHKNKTEVSRKRKVPARNARKTTKR